MRRTIFCSHYRAMAEHTTCAAGVCYELFRGLAFEARPCFARQGQPAPGGCPLAQFPTAEELAAEEAALEFRFALIAKARREIVTHLGGPWKRGTAGAEGRIDCPVCGAQEALRFVRSGYNGHIHAVCTTGGCVSWME